MDTETITWSEPPNGGQATAEQRLPSESRINREKQDCKHHIRMQVANLSNLNWQSCTKIITEFKGSPNGEVKVSKDKCNSRGVA